MENNNNQISEQASEQELIIKKIEKYEKKRNIKALKAFLTSMVSGLFAVLAITGCNESDRILATPSAIVFSLYLASSISSFISKNRYDEKVEDLREQYNKTLAKKKI